MRNDGEILKLKIRGKGLSQLDASAMLGVSRQTLNSYFGKYELPEIVIQSVKEKLSIDLNEDLQNVNHKQTNIEAHAIPFDEYMEVPFIPVYAQAGKMIGFNESEKQESTMLVPREFEKGNYIVVEIDGDSMNDGTDRSICNGDRVLVKEIELSAFLNSELNIKRTLFCIVYNGSEMDGVVCKQVLKIDAEKKAVTIHSWNKDFKDMHLKMPNIIQVFVLKKIVEKRIKF